MVPSDKAAYLKGSGSNTGHYLPNGVEGSEVRIKNTSDTGTGVSGIGEIHTLI